MKIKKGYFIVLEGGEGSGKTSLLKRIQGEYGNNIVVTREPGGSKFAEEIRNVILNSPNAHKANALTMFLSFCAARSDHMRETVIPALRAGKIVISDRFDGSTFAYQIIAQKNKELRKIFWIIRNIILENGKYSPNLYVYLDVNPEIGLIRRDKDKGQQNHFDRRDIKFHQTLQKGFKEFFANKNQPVKKLIINAENSQEQVFQDMRQVLDKLV